MSRIRPPRVAAVALIWLVTATVVPLPTAPTLPAAFERAVSGVSPEELRRHVETLASDAMAGRGVGQEGNARAVAYVADALRAIGAAPAGGSSFLQPVVLRRPALTGESRLVVKGADAATLVDITPNADFHPHPSTASAAASGRLVSGGHGISAPKYHHDDYGERDVKGAVVLVMDGVPASLARRLAGMDALGELATVAQKARTAADRGAAALVVIQPHMPDLESVWPEPSSRDAASYQLQGHNRLPIVVLSDRAATGVRTALQRGEALTASVTPGVGGTPVTVHNALGIVEGRGGISDEMLIVGAHLDHDGTDAAGHVYNGADDNASGTAAVLEAARVFARAAAEGNRPARAVLFALWNAEEQGSLGAEAFLDAPLPPRRVVAKLNLDMVGRSEDIGDPDDPRFHGFRRGTAEENRNAVHLLGYTYAPELARSVRSAAGGLGLVLRQQYDRGAHNLLQRSDNWPFLRRGIPAVFLTTGLHPDYHTPEDDTERIDFAKLERITKLTARAAWIAADGPVPRLVR